MNTSTLCPLESESGDVAERIAARLHRPSPPPPQQPWATHSLAQGAAGIALLHIERARADHDTWKRADAWITSTTSAEISAADNTGLYLGAPAIAFVLDSSGRRYASALEILDRHVAELAHRRVDTAIARLGRGELTGFSEYDIFFGLTGIGAHLLRRDPHGSAFGRILDYLVALTRPVRMYGRELPGWWVGHDPRRRRSARFTQGHGNLGAAHGITGPLLLLSQAMRRGHTVQGQREAISAICAHLSEWKQENDIGIWWPEHITAGDLQTGKPHQPGPARPSWCYGTPGIARAGQLAAIAIADRTLQHTFEKALSQCLADTGQISRLTDARLCHGWAGVYQTAWRAAQDALTPQIGSHLPHIAAELTRHAHPAGDMSSTGLLEGAAGTALALMTAASNTAPTTGWDACLLID